VKILCEEGTFPVILLHHEKEIREFLTTLYQLLGHLPLKETGVVGFYFTVYEYWMLSRL
jgi:hypothetical protein